MYKTSEQIHKSLDLLNTKHRNIKFTTEKEKNQNLPPLDVRITKTSKNRITTNYKESTDFYYSTNLSY